MADIIRHDGEAAADSGGTDKDVLRIDRFSCRIEVREQVAREQRLVYPDWENFDSAQDFVLDTAPKHSAVVQPGGAMTQFHHADARGEECLLCFFFESLYKRPARLAAQKMAQDVSVQ